MKTYDDVNIGDTVYIFGNNYNSIEETTVTEKYDCGDHWDLKFSNECEGYALKNMSSSIISYYGCLVFSDKEAVINYINERFKTLNKIIYEETK